MAQGLPDFTEDQANAFKRATIYDAIPQPLQPIQSSQNLTARAELETRELNKHSQYTAQLRQRYRVGQKGGLDEKIFLINYRAATSKATTDLQNAQKELDKLKSYSVLPDDDKARVKQLEETLKGGLENQIDKYLNGSDAQPQEAPKPKPQEKSLLQKVKDRFFSPNTNTAPPAQPGQKRELYPGASSKWDKYKRTSTLPPGKIR